MLPRSTESVLLALLVAATSLSAAAAQRLPRIEEIDGDRVHTVLPPDRIRAIDRPRFATAEEAGFMRDEEPVVGVVHNGIAKAYSLWHLDQHEIVNDQFGEDPIAVTW